MTFWHFDDVGYLNLAANNITVNVVDQFFVGSRFINARLTKNFLTLSYDTSVHVVRTSVADNNKSTFPFYSLSVEQMTQPILNPF